MRWGVVEGLVPAESAFAWSALTVIVVCAHVFAFLAAAWSVMNSPRLTRGGRLLWLVVIVALPFLGAIAWFVWVRRARLEQPVP